MAPRKPPSPEPILRAFWAAGDLHYDGPDRRGTRILHAALTQIPRDSSEPRNLLDQLEAAGYDSTSLKLAVRRRPRASWVVVLDGQGQILVSSREGASITLPGALRAPGEQLGECAERGCLAETGIHPTDLVLVVERTVGQTFVSLFVAAGWEGSIRSPGRWIPIEYAMQVASSDLSALLRLGLERRV